MTAGAAALGDAWRAAAGAPAAGARATTLVVLADAERPREVMFDEGLPHHAVALADVKAGAAKPKEDDGFDYVRQQAVRDAERALGIVRRDAPRPAIAPPPQRTSSGAPPQNAAPQQNAPPQNAAPQQNAQSQNAATPQKSPPPAAPGAPPRRRSRKALEHFGDPESTRRPAAAADAQPAAPPPTPPPPAPDPA